MTEERTVLFKLVAVRNNQDDFIRCHNSTIMTLDKNNKKKAIFR